MIAGLMSNVFFSFYKCVLYDANANITRRPSLWSTPYTFADFFSYTCTKQLQRHNISKYRSKVLEIT